jgi:hypothetical protein
MDLERMGEGTTRVPIWLGVLPPVERFAHVSAPSPEPAQITQESIQCEFRGFGIDPLQTVLATGIDVTPTDAPIYKSDFQKAWEYGGIPKVVLALAREGMEYSSKHVPRTLPKRNWCRFGPPIQASRSTRTDSASAFTSLGSMPEIFGHSARTRLLAGGGSPGIHGRRFGQSSFSARQI